MTDYDHLELAVWAARFALCMKARTSLNSSLKVDAERAIGEANESVLALRAVDPNILPIKPAQP